MGIGNLGLSELLIIAVIVLIFFGPSRLPEIGRSVGGALREFKKGMNEVKRELEEVERRAKGEDADRRDGERDRPSGRVSPPRSIEDAPTFGSRRRETASQGRPPEEGEPGGESVSAGEREPAEEHEEDSVPESETDAREGSQP